MSMVRRAFDLAPRCSWSVRYLLSVHAVRAANIWAQVVLLETSGDTYLAYYTLLKLFQAMHAAFIRTGISLGFTKIMLYFSMRVIVIIRLTSYVNKCNIIM